MEFNIIKKGAKRGLRKKSAIQTEKRKEGGLKEKTAGGFGWRFSRPTFQ